MNKRRFHSSDFEEYKNTNKKVIELEDIKDLLKDYLKIWKKEEIEGELRRWFSDEVNIRKNDEG